MIKNISAIRLVALAGILLAATAFSTGAAETKIEGVIFANYSLYTSEYRANGALSYDYNSFDVGRVYVTANTRYSPALTSKIVLEGNTLSTGNNIFLKNAFLQWKSEKITIEGGLPGTLWNGAEEALWKYRFVEKVQTDLEGILKSADKGAKIAYALPGAGGSAEAMLTNGEGGTAPENANSAGKGKDAQFKLTLTPLRSFGELSVSAHYLGGIISGRSRERLVGGVFYQGKKFSAGASLFKSVDFSTATAAAVKSGYSIYGGLPIRAGLSLFARLDGFDPDLTRADGKKTMLIGGAAYELAQDVKIALSVRRIMWDLRTPSRENQSVLSCDLAAKF